MTDRNITESGIVLQYKFDGIEKDVVDLLCQSNDLELVESTDGGTVAVRKTNKDYVVFKWFAEDKEYYSNYSVSTLKNGVLKENTIKTSGGAMSELDKSLLEAVTKVLSAATEKQEIIEETDNIDNVVNSISKKTEQNDHTGAAMELAKYLKATRFIKILKAVSDIQDAEGSMPTSVSRYRDEVVHDMLMLVTDKDKRNKLKGAF